MTGGEIEQPRLRRQVGPTTQPGIEKIGPTTDAGLQHVGHLTHLQELNLAWLESISGEGLIACLTPLAKMQRLDLEGLKLVTDEHLLLMRGAMPDLVHLNLTWCSDPTDGGCV